MLYPYFGLHIESKLYTSMCVHGRVEKERRNRKVQKILGETMAKKFLI